MTGVRTVGGFTTGTVAVGSEHVGGAIVCGVEMMICWLTGNEPPVLVQSLVQV